MESMEGSMAGLLPEGVEAGGWSIQHQCVPLGAMLLALGGPRVNYLSLDIEGAELQVRPCFVPASREDFKPFPRCWNQFLGIRWTLKLLQWKLSASESKDDLEHKSSKLCLF